MLKVDALAKIVLDVHLDDKTMTVVDQRQVSQPLFANVLGHHNILERLRSGKTAILLF